MYTIKDLYDLDHTLSKDYLSQFTYPWEALKGIKDFILQLGPTLDPEEYEEDPESATDSENPGEENGSTHDGVQNTTEAVSEAEKDNTRNADSSTPGNTAGAVPKKEKEGSQAKNKAGGDT